MSSRDKILASIRKNQPDSVPAPEVDFEKIAFEDVMKQFSETLEFVGGMAKVVPRNEKLENYYEISPDAKVLSAINEIESRNIEPENITCEHDMKDIDYACFDVELAVAENGSFLTHCEDFKFRSVYFLAQHLIVRVKKSKILNNMHEAYAELAKMKRGSFTAFISGPSKTADIEQCLVIGAHGARSLQVLIVED
ncbi:MAG: LUD domain-containing protein [Lentisphaeraceae bacterium]|nr:LUD domain-containing protein [Lentisphaeraceae bacterium]